MPPDKKCEIVPIAPKPRGGQTKYDPEYCWTIRLLAQEGKLVEEWCAEIGVSRATLYRWADEHPEFRDAWEIAKTLLRAYYTRKGREGMNDAKFRSHAWAFFVTRRFPDLWGPNATDATELPTAPDSETPITLEQAERMTPEERKAKIAEYLARERHDDRD